MSNQAHSFSGNLTRDPVIRKVPGKNGEVGVASFSVAVNGRNPEDTVYLDCEVWNQGAEVIEKWFKKGVPISINDAEIRNDTWEDKMTGENRSKLKFRVNRFSFVPTGKKVDGETTVETSAPTQAETPKKRVSKNVAPPKDKEEDDDIPF